MSPATAPTAAWSYRAGEWFAVVGPRTTLLLPAGEKERVVGLWALVDDGAEFGDVLDGLVSTGLSSLPGFVLVGSDEHATTVLLRGPEARAALETPDGTVEVTGSGAATWTERRVEGVTALTVTTGDEEVQREIQQDDDAGDGPPARHYPIDRGLVRVSRVDRPERTPAAAPAEEQEGEADTDAGAAPYAGLDILEPAADQATDEPTDEPADEPAATGEVGPETVAYDPLAASTGAAPPDPDPDHDGMTRVGTGPSELATPPPGIPGQPPAPSVTRPVARLLVSNGEAVDVDRVILLGRAPEARRFSSSEQPRLVTVPSPLHEISSTHVEVRPGTGADHDSAVVTDLGSTNGTVLEQPGLEPEELVPGVAVQLIPGAVINLGDGVTIQVARP